MTDFGTESVDTIPFPLRLADLIIQLSPSSPTIIPACPYSHAPAGIHDATLPILSVLGSSFAAALPLGKLVPVILFTNSAHCIHPLSTFL